MGKGSKRRKENKALIDKNWDKVFNGDKGKNDSRLGKAWGRMIRDLLGIK